MRYLRYLKTSLPLIVFFGLTFFLWEGLAINPTFLSSTLINRPAPEFNVGSLQNPNVQLSNKIFLGHVSMLNVWASWCSTCANEYPILLQIHQQNSIPIYGLDYKDNRQAALAVLNKFGNPYKAIGFDQSGNVAIDWGVYGTPETFVIDKQGIVRYKLVGGITMNIWRGKILPLINQLEQNS